MGRGGGTAVRIGGERVPFPIVALASIGAALIALPVLALLVRAPWSSLGETLSSTGAWTAFRLSIVVSLAATALSLLFGVPLAWVLARGRLPGTSVLRAIVILPIVLPPVVGGIGLLAALGRGGVVGRILYETLGVQLTFTTAGAVLAATFVAMPLVVLATEAGLRSLDPRLEMAAAVSGAGPWTTFRRVSLPSVLPQVVAGGVLAWARALGEFGATITFAGNLAGRTQTLPLAAYEARQTDPGGAVLMSLLLVVLSVAVLVAMRDRITRAR
jgi:molybdate transport system permease protein